jgi:hypothetical protein
MTVCSPKKYGQPYSFPAKLVCRIDTFGYFARDVLICRLENVLLEVGLHAFHDTGMSSSPKKNLIKTSTENFRKLSAVGKTALRRCVLLLAYSKQSSFLFVQKATDFSG